ncbi:MAG: hypothetical protein K0S71_349 [Clostridia bacterium]|jgi:hypothetical protein|nr:hypothetical protein [Clostridia bacterium]
MIKYEFKNNKLIHIANISYENADELITELLLLKMLKTKELITQSEYDKTITLLKREKTLNIKIN